MSHALYPAYRLNRHKLLVSCATLAITVALTPSRAWAQAFQGTPTTASGTITYSRSTPGTETVTVGSSTATINWAPSDTSGTGNINFLPLGNTATYQAASGIADFTVLNRVMPTDATREIELNGSLLSKLSDGTTGGNVWFYSPGGILVGSKATIDVGGLLLSSIDLPGGFTTNSTGFSASFRETQTSAGPIQVMPGAMINAQSSYVALVAPRIEQGGNVQVNGSAAYVAANQASLTFNSGLFDISIPDGGGTADPNGIVHTGTTGGPANSTPTDNHGIYMMVLPRNQALTMLLDGNIGFDAATSASVINGQIYLTGASTTAGGTSGLTIGSQSATNVTSPVIASMDGSILVEAATGDTTFSGDLNITNDATSGLGGTQLLANNGHKLTVNGNALLDGGDHVDLSASGQGGITVTGTLDADPGSGPVTLSDGEGTGTVSADTLDMFGSTVTLNGSPTVNNLYLGVNGDFTIGDLSVPGDLFISAGGNLTTTGTLTSGNGLTLAANNGNLSVQNATVTGADGLASFYASGLASFTGTVNAPDIYVTSSDINIASGASLGVEGATNLVAFIAMSNQPVYIGAGLTPPTGAYVLNEAGSIKAREVMVTSESSADAASPDIIIGDVKIDGSQTAGGGVGDVIVDSPGGSIKV
ncbi:MAG: two-partner secretion domain-containing protein, partial [Sphingomicrobium sp.]